MYQGTIIQHFKHLTNRPFIHTSLHIHTPNHTQLKYSHHTAIWIQKHTCNHSYITSTLRPSQTTSYSTQLHISFLILPIYHNKLNWLINNTYYTVHIDIPNYWVSQSTINSHTGEKNTETQQQIYPNSAGWTKVNNVWLFHTGKKHQILYVDRKYLYH